MRSCSCHAQPGSDWRAAGDEVARLGDGPEGMLWVNQGRAFVVVGIEIDGAVIASVNGVEEERFLTVVVW